LFSFSVNFGVDTPQWFKELWRVVSGIVLLNFNEVAPAECYMNGFRALYDCDTASKATMVDPDAEFECCDGGEGPWVQCDHWCDTHHRSVDGKFRTSEDWTTYCAVTGGSFSVAAKVMVANLCIIVPMLALTFVMCCFRKPAGNPAASDEERASGTPANGRTGSRAANARLVIFGLLYCTLTRIIVGMNTCEQLEGWEKPRLAGAVPGPNGEPDIPCLRVVLFQPFDDMQGFIDWFIAVLFCALPLALALGREQQIGGSGGSLEPPGPHLQPPGPLLTRLHTVHIAYSECLPTRLNPLAERTGFPQALGIPVLIFLGLTRDHLKGTVRPGHTWVEQYRPGLYCPGPPGRLSARSIFPCRSGFYGAFAWARRARA
jgi:hypothetical protein